MNGTLLSTGMCGTETRMPVKDLNSNPGRLVAERLLKEGDVATRSVFVGVNVLSIALCFFWLVANSFHVTSTDWICGVEGLIHALTVMEVGLLVLLYYTIKDASGAVRKAFLQRLEFPVRIGD